MALLDFFQPVSAAPIDPHVPALARVSDAANLYRGSVKNKASDVGSGPQPLDERLRQACFWIVNTVIISPHFGIENLPGGRGEVVQYTSNLVGVQP